MIYHHDLTSPLRNRLQMATIAKEDDVEDLNHDDIGMNEQTSSS